MRLKSVPVGSHVANVFRMAPVELLGRVGKQLGVV